MRPPSQTVRPPSPQTSSTVTGGQYFDRRGEVMELKQGLRTALAERDNEKMKDVIKKVIGYMTLGIDMSRLFSEMVMAAQLGDVVQKKMVYLYLTAYAKENSDLAILTVNTLQKDTRDVDPTVRGLALRSLCSMQMVNMMEYLEPAISEGLVDPSGYVRKFAVMGVLKLFHMLNGDKSYLSGFVTKLNAVLLTDSDANVVSNILTVLDELDELRSKIDKPFVYYLLNRFAQFSEWGKSVVIEKVLLRYFPPSEEELFEILNCLDPYLRQTSANVSLGICKIFLMYTQDKVDMHEQVLYRLKDTLLTLFSSASVSVEMQLVVAAQIETLLDMSEDRAFACNIFSSRWKSHFLLSEWDSVELAMCKVSILGKLAAHCTVYADIAVQILAELQNSFSAFPLVVPSLVEAMVDIALVRETLSSSVFASLVDLAIARDYSLTTGGALHANNAFLQSNVLCISSLIEGMARLLQQYPEEYLRLAEISSVIDSIVDSLDLAEPQRTPLINTKGLTALIWILGEFGKSELESAPYLLETISGPLIEEDQQLMGGSDTASSISSAELTSCHLTSNPLVQTALLSAALKIFIGRPLEGRPLLERLIRFGIEEATFPEVRDLALLYYRLLVHVGPGNLAPIVERRAESSAGRKNTVPVEFESFNSLAQTRFSISED